MALTADDYMRSRRKLQGREAGRAARFQALQNELDRKKKSRGGTKASGLQPGDVDVERSIRKGY